MARGDGARAGESGVLPRRARTIRRQNSSRTIARCGIIAVFDPKTKNYTFVDTCFGTHHLQFGYDANETLWTSGGGPVLGWVNTKQFLQTGDAAKSQGWTAFVLDTQRQRQARRLRRPERSRRSGEGQARRDAVLLDHAEPGGRIDLGRGDGQSRRGRAGGAWRRIRPRPRSPRSTTCRSPGFGARGADIDGNGVVWVSLASGHLGSFDRRKCKGPLNGPKATGDHCPEGWSFHQYPGPGFEGIGENSAESSYYTWVDQHDTFGLGRNVPVSTGNLNDGLIAYANGRMVVLRVPHPLGFYAKGLDGRIDDPNAGWKGRGLWSANGDRTPWLIEGGKGTKPLAAHFQLRPDPLAK